MVRERVYGTSPLKRGVAKVFPRCPGCTTGLVEKAVLEVLEETGLAGKAILIPGIGCHITIMPEVGIDAIQNAHGPAPAVATGVKHAHFGDALVFTVQGDGDCAAIGAGYLVNAAARSEKITVFMVNNAVYGTTGGQMAPTTLLGQVTTTTPYRRDTRSGYPTHVAELVAGIRGVAYSARASLSSPANYQRAKKAIKTAFQKQMDGVGFSFVEFLSTCPTNWHLSPVDSLKWIDEEMTREFPLGEFKNVDCIE